MALKLGTWSASSEHDFRLGDAKVSAFAAPTKGSTNRGNVTVTFTLQSFVVTAASITLKYSKDGQTFSNATVASGAVTALTVSETGTSHTVVWDSVTDLGDNNKWESVHVGIEVDDASAGGGSDDRVFKSDYFTVDNLPTVSSILEPPTGEFQKSLVKNIEFSIPATDPGSGVSWPVIRADMLVESGVTPAFNSAELVYADSNVGTNHLFFDHQVNVPTTKPIAGYYVQGVTVSGSTVKAYNTMTDFFTGSTLPTTITNASVIVIPRNDRRCFVTAFSNTSVTLDESASGSDPDGLVDLFILDDSTVDFFVKSGVSVTSTTFATTTFASLGNDDFGNDITDTFAAAPRIMLVDEADRMTILGPITTTGVDLKKSSTGGSSNATVTLFILKTNADIYQDVDESVTSSTLTQILMDSLTDSTALPEYIGGAIVFPTPKDDRHAYIDAIYGDQFKAAKSSTGTATDGKVDWCIWQKTAAAAFWVPLSPTGLPSGFEGLRARYRPQSGDFKEGLWAIQSNFGNT